MSVLRRIRRIVNVEYGRSTQISKVGQKFLPDIQRLLQVDRLKDWQAHAFDTARMGHDLVIKAGTGAGKTKAVLSMLASKPNATVLILVPLKAIMSDAVYLPCFKPS
jgi:ATP-dependent helicase YprA (DUF1998 family)